MNEKRSPDKAGRAKTLIYAHCRGFKPEPTDLGALCRDAIAFGLERDRPKAVGRFEAAGKELAYYGDLNREVLNQQGERYNAPLDLRDRHAALERLKALDKAKKFTLPRYDRLPGKNSRKEFLADALGPLLKGVGLSELMIRKLIPELGCYWQPDHDFRITLLERVLTRLISALRRGDDVLVLSHGLGSIVVYDAMWHLSHDPGAGGPAKVVCWITLGSPLGNETVKSKLAGAKEPIEKRYPTNVVSWHNVAAEDDYLCHDKAIADDFAPMLKRQMISSIRDYKIYNLAVRYGKSNPHSSIGYLIHPRVIALIADWLKAEHPA